ncbi:MAG TPA: hypothetical protein ENI80_00920 [Acidiferrobacteraceae bacterium]|nr:hypothetical protein [Acidiferrobacteraceae bacterium]
MRIPKKPGEKETIDPVVAAAVGSVVSRAIATLEKQTEPIRKIFDNWTKQMVPAMEAIKETIHLWHLDDLHRKYSLKNNPLYVWHGFKYCRKHDLSIPGWIDDYLDRVAINLTTINRRDISPGKVSDEIKKAVEMDRGMGSGTVFSDHEDTNSRLEVVLRACELIDEKIEEQGALKRGDKKVIWDQVAEENNKSWEYVRDQYAAYEDFINSI